MVINGLLAISVLHGAASLIFLLLYLLLSRSCPERFFRYWVAGWAVESAAALSAAVLGFWFGGMRHFLGLELAFAAPLFLLASAFQYIGWERRVHYLWPVGAVAAVGVGLAYLGLPGGNWLLWAARLLEAGLYVAGGWLLWRAARTSRGYGVALLGAAMLLRGLHKIDQASWLWSSALLLRMAFDTLFALAVGVGMAVLVLEAARARTEDLNAKLSRLTLMTAAATETLCVEDVLQKVLQQLTEGLAVSHGFIRLLEGQGDSAQLVIRTSVGFTEDFLELHGSLPASEPWAQNLFSQEASYLAVAEAADAELRQWMREQRLLAMVLVRMRGDEAPIGVLGVGSAVPRVFQQDELNFLVNVANLLGLTILNIRHFEKAAIAQRQWAATFDDMNDPILLHDSQYRLLRTNRAAAERLNASVEALLGRPMRELLRRGEARWNHCPYCEGAAGRAESRDPTFGGYLLATISAYEDPVDGRRGTIHVLRDITERKSAEEKYRSLFENVQEGVFISTPGGRFVDFNDAFRRMLGYNSREELMAVDISKDLFANPADRERLKKLLREHGSVSGFEFQMRRKDGELITVLESSVATRDSAGAIVAFQGFDLDITERKQADVELRRRNRELVLLNAIGLTLSQPLALDDLLTRSLEQVLELFALDLGAIYLVDEREGLVGRRAAVGLESGPPSQFPASLLPGDLLRQLRKAGTSVLAPQALQSVREFRCLPESEGIAESRLVVLWSKDRILGGLLVGSRSRREFSAAELNLLAAIGNQIAATIEKTLLHEETRQAFEHLRRTQEQLVQSEKMVALGQLISGVAHELNNPLTAILGYSQLLGVARDISPQASDFAAKIAKQAHRTQRIVQNLLSFSRQQKPERRPVQLNDVLEDTVSLRDYDWRKNNIEVFREFDPRLPLTAGDRHQLQQVFLNILNNAFDALKDREGERKVWIRTLVRDLRLCVEIADSGPGVREPRRVFDPFYTTKPIGEGTGLGLSICYGIIKEHGGEISAHNAPPRGAMFSVLLPISTPVSSHDSQITPLVAMASPGSAILLVDDEEAVLEVEREVLRERGHLVYTAKSGDQAIEILERSGVDAVVTNWKLPGPMSGEALYGWIERNRPGLTGRVVVTLSEGQNEAAKALVARSGGCAVHKPFRVEEFLHVVQKALSENRTQPVKG